MKKMHLQLIKKIKCKAIINRNVKNYGQLKNYKKMSFTIPVFRPDLLNLDSFEQISSSVNILKENMNK